MKIKKWKVVVAVVALLVAGAVIAVALNMPKAVSSSDLAYDLSQIPDGTYTGRCDNGLVKVEVEVDVHNHTIAGVRIIQHDNGRGAPAEAIIGDVVTHQSVEVDAVSGATASSKTILKAIENALAGAREAI